MAYDCTVFILHRIKREGGKWSPDERVWKMPYDAAVKLGLKPRIIRKKSK